MADPSGLRARLSEAERLLYSDAQAADAMAEALVADCSDLDRSQAVLRVKAETVRVIVSAQAGRCVAAIDHGLRLVHQAAHLGDRPTEARLWNVIGAAYDTLALPERAVRCYDRGLQLLDPGEDAELVARLETNLGVAFSRMEEDERALVHFHRALEAGQAAGIQARQARVHLDLAISERRLGHRERATAALDRAETRAEDAGHQRSLPHILGERAELRALDGDLAAALDLLVAAGTQAEAFAQLDVAAQLALRRSQLLRQAPPHLGGAAAAVAAARSGLQLALRLDTPEWRRKLHVELSHALDGAGDPVAALDHLRQAHALSDREHRRQRQQELATLRVEHDVDALRREQAALRAERAALATANARLRQLSRERQELYAIATHDLRNPLHLVCLLADELADEGPRRRSAAEIGRMLDDAGRRMVETVDQILARHANGGTDTAEQAGPVSVEDAAARVIEAMRPVAEAKGIRLALHLQASGATVEAQDAELEQIIDNLVGNAVKFTPPDRRVDVRLERRGQELVLEVLDEGPGLTPEDLDRVFGKWARLSARPTGGESSSGLGLWITRERVERLGGRIYAASREGRGARFTVILPSPDR